jgi:GNAT superfamily N-acetyltransferase
MSPLIEMVDEPEDLEAVTRLRIEVFAREWRVPVEPAEPMTTGRVWHLVARPSARGRVVGALTVLDVTGESSLHLSCNLGFVDGMRVARYSCLGVDKHYRGRGIPLRLMTAARERIIVPNAFDISWLRFDAQRLVGCPFAATLGFAVRPGIVMTPAGPCAVLARLENRQPGLDLQPDLAA